MSKLRKTELVSLLNDSADVLHVVVAEMMETFPAYRFSLDESERCDCGTGVFVYLMSDETISLMQLRSYAQGYLRGVERSV